MKLVVVSHKETWIDNTSLSGYATIGGFPYQMQAIADLFDQTTLMTTLYPPPPPAGAIPLLGHNVHVNPLPAPAEADLRRKIALLFWAPRHLPLIWRAVKKADAVHTPVAGDIGTLGLLIALLQRKPLFVRHCGTWGEPVTLADRFLLWLLERIAGGRNVVLATGGADHLPSRRNPNIQWIFSTTLSQAELDALPTAQPWQPGEALRLVSVGRLSPTKNAAAIIAALPEIQTRQPRLHLDILGEGPSRAELENQVNALGVADLVTFHGNVSHQQVLEKLSQSHLFVFPTQVKEGFPKAVLEALACGLPVIAARVSVIPQLLGRGGGLLLEDTGPQAVAQAVLELIADPLHMAEMGRLARQSAQGFTLEAWGEAIRTHLERAWGPLRQDASGECPDGERQT